MLNSLEVRNYRILHYLNIPRLGHVNLLVGMNNTGKTSILEAISLYCQNGDLRWLMQLFEGRGEGLPRSIYDENQYYDFNFELISSLFYGRKAAFSKGTGIVIRDSKEENTKLEIRCAYYVEDTIESENGTVVKRRIIEESEIVGIEKMGLEIKFGSISRLVLFDRRLNRPSNLLQMQDNIQFIHSNITREINPKLWDKITLTEKESFVEKALSIIEEDIEKIAFISSNYTSNRIQRQDDRIPVVKLKKYNKPVNLTSMGDGINRTLSIILAMVNCQNGYLFIDEFENGLHYSVQKQLWEVIFDLSKKLNIQVFATTHSNDTIKSFEAIANSNLIYQNAELIRLRNIKGNISAVTFNAEELKIANETEYLDLR